MRAQIVIDTNVLYSALYSRSGASYLLVDQIGRARFDMHLSVSLAAQYEDVAKRNITDLGLDEQTIDDILDFIYRKARHHRIYYLWRPFLPDPGDDFVLELAVAAGCSHIITHNLRHFRDVQRTFGITPMTPLEFLQLIGVLK